MFDVVIVKECGDLIFDHYIGSELLNNRAESSDYDLLKVHKTKFSINDCFIENHILNMSKQSFFNVPFFENKIVKEQTVTEDTVSIDILALLLYLIDIEKSNVVLLSKIASHLYAVKYNLVTNIKDHNIYSFYVEWLKSPGIAHLFWQKYRQILWTSLSSLPDKNLNWSQKYNNSIEHETAKNNWEILEFPRYPTVDSELGYDPLETKRIIQTLMICTAILTNESLSQENKNLLTDLKNHQINFNDYLVFKKTTWKQFRIASESLNSLYFLGDGHSIEESKIKGTYGLQGLKNLFNLVSNIS